MTDKATACCALASERDPTLAAQRGALQPDFADTTFVRFLAILFVVNSHLEALYPRAWMAADGMIGDTLFFVVSGFNLALSPHGTRAGLGRWLWRRISRLYPSFLLVVLVFIVLLQGNWRHWGVTDYLRELIWPTRYTFFRDIVVCYIALYAAMKIGRPWVYLVLVGVVAALMVGFWLPDYWSMPASVRLSLGTRSKGLGTSCRFLAIFLGGWLATRPDDRRSSTGIVIATAALFLSYAALKYSMVVMGHWARFYPLLHVMVLLLMVLLFRLDRNRWVVFLVKDLGLLSRLISWVAALTLEIYLIHELVAQSRWILALKFPVNLVGLAIGTLVLAAATASVAGFLRKRLLDGGAVRRPAASSRA